MDFTLTSCAATGLLRSFDGERSCILYFFGLGKYMKKSLWSHLLLFSDSLNVKRMPSWSSRLVKRK